MSEVTHQEIKGMFEEQGKAFGDILDNRLERQTQAVLGVLQQELAPISARLNRHEAILESNTLTLDGLAKNSESARIIASSEL